MLKSLASQTNEPTPPNLAHPGIRAWLDALPAGHGRGAAFETRIWWSPGSAAKAILKKLEQAGYRPVARAQRFIARPGAGPGCKAGPARFAPANWSGRRPGARSWRRR